MSKPKVTESTTFIDDFKPIGSKMKTFSTSKTLYVDTNFPKKIEVVWIDDQNIEWKRIKDADGEARIFSEENPLGGEIVHTSFGLSSFAATLSALANHPRLFQHVFPSTQEFDNPSYCGLFYFRFWKMGKWVYVEVDDTVPFENEANDKGKFPSKSAKLKSTRKSELSGKSSSSSKSNSHMKPDQDKSTPILKKNGSKIKVNEIIEQQGHLETGGTQENANLTESKNGNDTTRKVDSGENIALTGVKGDSPHNSAGYSEKVEKLSETTSGTNISKSLAKKVEKSALSLATSSISWKEEPKFADIDKSRPISSAAGDSSGAEVQLATTTPENKRNIFVHVSGPGGKRFYWATLFEKAYAKFCGGYNKLSQRGLLHTLLDFTGGITEEFHTNYLPPNFFLELKSFSDNDCLILAATTLSNNDGMTTTLPADSNVQFFAITSVIFADFNRILGRDKMVGFVKIRNPHGLVKWNETWTEAAKDWKTIPLLTRQKLKMKTREEGEFYLTYNNFLKAFSTIFVCTVPDGQKWNVRGFPGQWTVPRLTYNMYKADELRFHEFPQHVISVLDPNDDDPNFPVDVLISLVQNSECSCSPTTRSRHLQLFLFCLKRDYVIPLQFDFFRYNKPIGWSNISDQQEVTARFKLYSGQYLVVLVTNRCCEKTCINRDYLLRVVNPAKFQKDHMNEGEPCLAEAKVGGQGLDLNFHPEAPKSSNEPSVPDKPSAEVDKISLRSRRKKKPLSQ